MYRTAAKGDKALRLVRRGSRTDDAIATLAQPLLDFQGGRRVVVDDENMRPRRIPGGLLE
jgi:hypothetical protein